MKTYQMYRGSMVRNGYGSGFHGTNYTPTSRTFAATTEKAATKKMGKFIRDAGISGSFFVKEIIES